MLKIWEVEAFAFIVLSISECFFFSIRIHSTQGWPAATKHGITRKDEDKDEKHICFLSIGNFIRKNLKTIGIC